MAGISTNETIDGGDSVKDSTSPELDDVLADARKFLRLCKEFDSVDNTAMLDDLKFLSGGLNQWDAQDAAQRTIDGRPMITVNKLPTFLHQVTNNLRMNKTSIKVHPANGGNIDVAKVRQGLIRHIEYDSNADYCYSTAACSAAAIGKGYWRIVTEYENHDSFDQDIKFKRIRNPFVVHFDPLSENPDGSDAKRVLIESRMTREEFKRQWPKANANDTNLALGNTEMSQDWMFQDEVVVAEYYRVEETADKLWLLNNGATVWASDVKKDEKLFIEAMKVKERDGFKRKVMLYKVTGCDMLEQTEIKCYWIPVFPCYGDELDIDGKVIRSGLIRHSKDSLKMYNYWMTCATEEVAMRPKIPYIGAAGQFEDFEQDWALANKKSFPYIQYNPVTVDGNLAPPPSRQMMVDIPSGMLQMAMHANDNIKATTGLFDSSLGARGNATSGKQELAQQKQGDVANFHYLDGLQVSVRQCGRCINWMIPYYYDTTRVVKIMGDDEKVSTVTINRPNPLGGAIEQVLNDMTGGEYTVTVESGPPYQTLRQEAAELFSDMAHNNQQLMQVAGDLIIGEMDIPGADKIAARIKKAIPPALTAGEDEGADAQSVEAKLQQIGQMSQAMEQKSQQMQEHMQILTETEAKVKEEMLKLKEEQAALSVTKAEINAAMQIEKANTAAMKAQLALATAGEGGEEVKPDIEWQKALLEADTKIAVAEINAKTQVATSTISANSAADGSTTVGEDGEKKTSPALAAVLDAVHQNMKALVDGQQQLAQQIAKPKKRKSKAAKQADGSYLLESIEE